MPSRRRGTAATGAILGAAIPLVLALHETWQFSLLAAAALALLALRRNGVLTLIGQRRRCLREPAQGGRCPPSETLTRPLRKAGARSSRPGREWLRAEVTATTDPRSVTRYGVPAVPRTDAVQLRLYEAGAYCHQRRRNFVAING